MRLSDETSEDYDATPRDITGLIGHDVVRLFAGGSHSCALLDDGGVICWGAASAGQLGIGSTEANTDFENVSDLEADVTTMALGKDFTCALLSNGAVKCWGDDFWGQLGDGGGAGSSVKTPIFVNGLDGTGELATGIAAGDQHACAQLANGSAMCWGNDTYGQLGSGSALGPFTQPQTVAGLDGKTVVGLSVGRDHSCALLSTGEVKCWGSGTSGQLGNGALKVSLTPVSVLGLDDASVAQLASGFVHSCVLLATGAVRCWGDNSDGALGDGRLSFLPAPGEAIHLEATVSQLAVTDVTAFALTSDGAMYGWGQNAAGLLMADTCNLGTSYEPLTLTGFSAGSVAKIIPGPYHACALKTDGTLACWGSNYSKQLGSSSTNYYSYTPLTVPSFGEAIIDVAVGIVHSCALLQSGAIKCWGDNSAGQLGDGTRTARTAPVTVSDTDSDPKVALAAGGYDTCALYESGKVKCWGANDSGQVGSGDTDDVFVPTEVSGLTGAIAIHVGDSTACAILNDHSVMCWGVNDYGQLGSGDSEKYSAVPVAVSDLENVADLSIGVYHACALLTDGTAKCWGSGSLGRLGDGTGLDHATPVAVSDLENAIGIQTHFAGSCAMLASGSIRCWGGGAAGVLGIGEIGFATTPHKLSW